MPRKTYLVNIDSPCSESWQEMSPEDGGRHCMRCSKKVIDFSTLSDDEVIKILSQQKGNVCGRFQAGQLNKELIESKRTYVNKGFYKYLAGLLLLGISKNAFSGNNKFLPKENIVASPVQQENVEEIFCADTLYKEIKGKVLDSVTKRPIAYATIEIGNAKFMTDSAGYYQLKIPYKTLNDNLVLKIASVGYYTKKSLINIEEMSRDHQMYLSQMQDQILGDVVIVKKHKKKKRWLQFWQ